MSTLSDLKTYRFATRAQWETGLLAKLRVQGDGALMPEQPLAPSPRFIGIPGGAWSPSFSPHGVAYWRSSAGLLQWMENRDSTACSIEAATDIASSPRLAVGREWLWAFRPGTPRLVRHDLASLQQDDVICLGDGDIRDIAADGCDGVWALVGHAAGPDALCHVDANGRVEKTLDLPRGIAHPRGISYLPHSRRLALLTDNGAAIVLLNPENPAQLVTIPLQQETSGFHGSLIDSDHCDRVLIGGSVGFCPTDHEPSTVLLLDSSGGLLERISVQQFPGLIDYLPITGATAHGPVVLLTTAKGILRFDAAPAGDAADAEGVFLSPALYSPDTASLRGWLRAELSALLPKGSTLAVTVMSTDEPGVRDEVEALSKDPSLPPRVRQQRIEARLQAGRTGPFVFASPEDDPSRPQGPTPQLARREPSALAVPLFDHQKPWLWLEVRLSAAPDGRLPALQELRALYPEISLSQHVPAIFRGDVTGRDPRSGDPSGFFRQLLGLLETTTQGIDRTIAALGRRIHPATAKGEWLDFVARWFDLPWDDALPKSTKQGILRKAAQLLARRGTRAGLETLLRVLFPVGRFRILDVNVDVGLATVGSVRCSGSALPAVLSGLPPHAAALSRKAVLGSARLTCPNDDPTGAVRFMGLLRIEILASDSERKAVESVLPALLAAMTPAGLRTLIHWRVGSGLGFDVRLDDGLTMDDPSPRRVGKDARLGQLVLAGGKYLRLTESGIRPGFRLN